MAAVAVMESSILGVEVEWVAESMEFLLRNRNTVVPVQERMLAFVSRRLVLHNKLLEVWVLLAPV